MICQPALGHFRNYVDDVTTALLCHLPSGRTRPTKRSSCIRVHHGTPLELRGIERRLSKFGERRIDQNVDTAKFRDGLINSGIRFGVSGEITNDRRGAPTLCGHGSSGGLDVLSGVSCHGNVRTSLRERGGEYRRPTTCVCGYQCNLVFKGPVVRDGHRYS